MNNTVKNIVELLKAHGIIFLPYDENLSFDNASIGSISWMECYEAEGILELSGYDAKMTAHVGHGSLIIQSNVNSDAIIYEEYDPDGFVEQVQTTMRAFYRDLII